MVYAYYSKKSRENHCYKKLSFFNVICRREYYAKKAGNGILLFLTLQASIYVDAHHIDLEFVLRKKRILCFSLF